MKKTVEIPLQTRAASVEPTDQDARTFRLTWSTGAAVRRMDFWTGRQWVEELSMKPEHIRLDRLNSGAPLLNTHGQWDLRQIIGVTEKAWLDGGNGMADVRFSRRADVDPIRQDVQDKIIRNVSVGYKVHRFEDVSTKEDTAADLRRLRAVDWEPVEISLVPVGADAKAGVRAEGEKHSCEIEYAERSAESVPEESAGQAAPPAQRGGVSLDLLRRMQEQVERENQ